ncbi:MAG: Universal stress protein family [Verrucomicrobiales bacterium]|nr:Universal stress protein family [Verrucomicrobiales bacterium]
MNINHILVPVDFSEGTPHAIEYAAGLGRKLSSRITLLHVMEPVTPPPDGLILDFDAYDHALAEKARKRLDELAADLDPVAGTALTSGNP